MSCQGCWCICGQIDGAGPVSAITGSGSKGEMLGLRYVIISEALRLPEASPTWCWRQCWQPPPGEQQQRQQEAVVPTLRQWHSLSQEHWPWHHGELLSRLLSELSISLASQSKQKGVSCGLWWPQCTDLQRPAWDCSVGVQRFQGFSENILGFKSTLNKTPGGGVCHLFVFFLPSL